MIGTEVWIHVMDVWLPSCYMGLQMPCPPTELIVVGSVCHHVLSMSWAGTQLVIDDEVVRGFPPRLPFDICTVVPLTRFSSTTVPGAYEVYLSSISMYQMIVVEQTFSVV